MNNVIFKNRYVLGEGYPWAQGIEPYTEISLTPNILISKFIYLDFPEELWSQQCPKYRIVLEKVEE